MNIEELKRLALAAKAWGDRVQIDCEALLAILAVVREADKLARTGNAGIELHNILIALRALDRLEGV